MWKKWHSQPLHTTCRIKRKKKIKLFTFIKIWSQNVSTQRPWFKHQQPRRPVSLRHNSGKAASPSAGPVPRLPRPSAAGPARRSPPAPPRPHHSPQRTSAAQAGELRPPPGLTWARVAGDEAAPTEGAGPELAVRRGEKVGREPFKMVAHGAWLDRSIMAGSCSFL